MMVIALFEVIVSIITMVIVMASIMIVVLSTMMLCASRLFTSNGGKPLTHRRAGALAMLVILLTDGETVHNVFFDRGFRP